MTKNQEPPSPRTLDRDVPELKSFLRLGWTVLDVGCGTGTITLGVAKAIHPSEVVGIDPSEHAIDAARKWAAQVSYPSNITFRVSDGHRLEFPDEFFDMAYSHTALHFFLELAS
jgi:ubiquinone/menaquinone biosynthesis C-methylase UbiE